MTIDLTDGWWVIHLGEEVVARMDNDFITMDLAYTVFDLLEKELK